MSGIRLSKKHGVNPSLAVCVACGKEWGVILFGRIKGPERTPERPTTGPAHNSDLYDRQAPRCVAHSFCDVCQKVLDQGGVILVECKDGTGKHPYRTGRVWGITNDAFARMFNVPRAPMCYIEESVARKIGFPDPPAKEAP